MKIIHFALKYTCLLKYGIVNGDYCLKKIKYNTQKIVKIKT